MLVATFSFAFDISNVFTLPIVKIIYSFDIIKLLLYFIKLSRTLANETFLNKYAKYSRIVLKYILVSIYLRIFQE